MSEVPLYSFLDSDGDDEVLSSAADGGLSLSSEFSTVLDLRALLRRIEKRFRGWLVFKAHIPVYHSARGSRVIKKKKKTALIRC